MSNSKDILEQIKQARQAYINELAVNNRFTKSAFVPAQPKQAGAMPPGPPPPPGGAMPPPPPGMDPNMMPPGGDPNTMPPPPPDAGGVAPEAPAIDPAAMDQMTSMIDQLAKGFEGLEQEVNSLKQQQMDILTKNAETQGMLNTILGIMQKGSVPNPPQMTPGSVA